MNSKTTLAAFVSAALAGLVGMIGLIGSSQGPSVVSEVEQIRVSSVTQLPRTQLPGTQLPAGANIVSIDDGSVGSGSAEED